MTAPELTAAATGAGLCVGVLLIAAGWSRPPTTRGPAAPTPPWLGRLHRLWEMVSDPGRPRAERWRRMIGWTAAGCGIWAVTGWPVAGLATIVAGLFLPWLLGSARIVQERLATAEALEGWCRRMADTLTGGGAIGLAQAIVTSATRVNPPITTAVHDLARRVQGDQRDPGGALREFADTIDDRAADAIAAALLLALHQQSTGVAQVLRQLADGLARDVRARREIEAARAESRQSIRMLLLIQVGLLAMIAANPAYAAAYHTAVGQTVMAVLLGGTGVLLVWMRRLTLGHRPPRFFGQAAGS
jgi:hypothetical protein